MNRLTRDPSLANHVKERHCVAFPRPQRPHPRPSTIELWDSNAKAGIPSKGLMQMIDLTFRIYHTNGTFCDIYDPIADIAAACNYAADRSGSMDNVNGAY
ncbi:hypothetical protein [Streptomyces sp. NPDC059828]|uniref:hypothetical protein n=1 Tax=Streptomyces sp. NPDC059828 TaxID=3346965 RepID=UPI00364BC0F6